MIVEFSRRKFLVAAGGTALAIPVLEALTPKKAHAAFENVRRMIFIIETNGSPRTSRPTGDGTGYTLGPILSGLEKHKADVLYVAGLDSRAAVLSNGDPHATGFCTTLSGAKALPGDTFKHGACFMSNDCPSTDWGGGATIDRIIGKAQIAAGVKIVHPSLNFAIKNTAASLYTRLCYDGPGQYVEPMASPADAFDALFAGASVGTTDPAVLARIKQRQQSVLDEVEGELVSLQGRISAADRLRLEQHVTALRELELRIQRMEVHAGNCTPPTKPTLGLGELVERNAGGMEENVDDDKNDSIEERHRVWREMTIRSLACDLTRVVCVTTAPSRADTFMPWLVNKGMPGDFNKPHHAASHDNDVETLTSMDNWYAQLVGQYVDDLKAEMDPTGQPMFASTAVAWFNELGEGGDHSHHDKWHCIVGSLGGFFKTGQLVRYPSGTPHNVLLTAIAQGMGLEMTHVGTTEPELMAGDVSLVKA